MSHFKDKTIWITGASSGIGRALTLNLAKQGAKLVISSRNVSALEEVKKLCEANDEDVLIQPLDLADQKSVLEGADIVLSKIQTLDYVFLNGGISQRAFVSDTSLEVDRQLMEVNYFGTIGLAKSILPSFIKQGHGHFVVTSSLMGVFGFPLRSAYAASKHALHGFFDVLRAEQIKNNVLVSIICPGFVKTQISVNAIGADGNPTGLMDKGQNKGMTPEACAKKILSATTQKKKQVYIGGKELVIAYFKRYIPWLYYKLASSIKPN